MRETRKDAAEADGWLETEQINDDIFTKPFSDKITLSQAKKAIFAVRTSAMQLDVMKSDPADSVCLLGRVAVVKRRAPPAAM